MSKEVELLEQIRDLMQESAATLKEIKQQVYAARQGSKGNMSESKDYDTEK